MYYFVFLAPSSSGLGHGLFRPGTRVRVPVGSQQKYTWARSSVAEQQPFKLMVEGSNPSGLTFSLRDGVMVARRSLEAEIGVQIPVPQQDRQDSWV